MKVMESGTVMIFVFSPDKWFVTNGESKSVNASSELKLETNKPGNDTEEPPI